MKDLSTIILCTNTVKGTKSLGSIPLLKINEKKTILTYMYNNIKNCWPNGDIICVTKQQDQRLNKHIENKYSDIKCEPYVVDEWFNESQALVQTFHKYGALNCLVLDINCVLDKNIFKKIKTYDTSKSFLIHNTHSDFKSKLGCILDNTTNKTQNIFFGLPNLLVKYYYISKLHAQAILDTNPAKSKFLFEVLNDVSKDIDVHSVKTKKCVHINSIKDYKKLKEINFV